MEALEIQYDKLLKQAIHLKATDLHFHSGYVIFRRYKQFILRTELNNFVEFYNFLKYKANIMLDSYRKTQTGSLKHVINDETYYQRLSILETNFTSHAVLRILNIHPIYSLTDCGFNKTQINQIKSMFKRGHGLVLFCGSTGSGKTTTMYSALNSFHNKQIFTLENPVERMFDNLIQLEYKRNEFNTYLLQLLRHDPDILAIGEIRSRDELEAVLMASLSGHMLAATMHAGSKEEALKKIELTTYISPDLVTGIVFQENRKGNFKFEVTML